MPTRIKICGLTRLEDAQRAVDLGAAALGFNFYPPSPRYIEPAAARAISGDCRPLSTAVGVFANETDAGQCDFTWRERQAQPPSRCTAPGFQLCMSCLPLLRWWLRWRCAKVSNRRRSRKFQASAYLLDAFDPDRLGRHGKNIRLERRAGSEAIWADHPGRRADSGERCPGRSGGPAFRRRRGKRRRVSSGNQGRRQAAGFLCRGGGSGQRSNA